MRNLRDLFSSIADVYDRMNAILSLGRDRYWRSAAVCRINHQPRQVLDIASGTGDLAFAAAKRFPDASIVGLDVSVSMLEIARAKNRFGNVRFMEANAAKLSEIQGLNLSDGVDLVTCAFGFRNFNDRVAVIREIGKVLRREGCLIVLEFFPSRFRIMRFFLRLWIRVVSSVLAPGRKEAYAYLAASIDKMIPEDDFVRLLELGGFSLVSRRHFFPRLWFAGVYPIWLK